jgi:hypothetical protein
MPGRLLQVGSVHWVQWDRWDDVACVIAWFADPWTVGVVRTCPLPLLECIDEHDYMREVPITHVHQQMLGEQAESLALVAAHNLANFVGQDEAVRLLGNPIRSLAS